MDTDKNGIAADDGDGADRKLNPCSPRDPRFDPKPVNRLSSADPHPARQPGRGLFKSDGDLALMQLWV